MNLIGITGGVGSGKSEVLSYIKNHYNAEVLLADDLANELKLPGNACYQPVIDCLGKQILSEDGTIDKLKMAQAIFASKDALKKINDIIHPAVRLEIMNRISYAKEKGKCDFFFLEAALLIEEHYDEVVDELWYIYANENVRVNRLMENRGYTKEKCLSIMQKQLSEQAFKDACSFVIDNSYDFEQTKSQIDKKMEEYPCVKQK